MGVGKRLGECGNVRPVSGSECKGTDKGLEVEQTAGPPAGQR